MSPALLLVCPRGNVTYCESKAGLGPAPVPVRGCRDASAERPGARRQRVGRGGGPLGEGAQFPEFPLPQRPQMTVAYHRKWLFKDLTSYPIKASIKITRVTSVIIINIFCNAVTLITLTNDGHYRRPRPEASLTASEAGARRPAFHFLFFVNICAIILIF